MKVMATPIEISPARANAARIIAVVADCLQIMIFPAFAEGFASPFNAALDVVVAVAMYFLLGFHWALLPSFFIELVPMADLIPTWTVGVFMVTGIGPPATNVPSTVVTTQTPRALEPPRDVTPPKPGDPSRT
jgi:hypothetical protein